MPLPARRIFHRRIRIFLLPAVWSQMVAAENNTLTSKSDFIGNSKNKFAKVCRCHSGITAKLIDWFDVASISTLRVLLRSNASAASITNGCAEQTEHMPICSPALCRAINVFMFFLVKWQVRYALPSQPQSAITLLTTSRIADLADCK